MWLYGKGEKNVFWWELSAQKGKFAPKIAEFFGFLNFKAPKVPLFHRMRASSEVQNCTSTAIESCCLLFGRKNFEIWEIHFWGVIEFPQWSGYANVPFTMEFVTKRMYDLKVLFKQVFNCCELGHVYGIHRPIIVMAKPLDWQWMENFWQFHSVIIPNWLH